MPMTPQEFDEYITDYKAMRDQRRAQVVEMMRGLGWDVETWEDVEKVLYAVALHEIKEEGDADTQE